MIDENELLKNLELYLNQTLLGEVTVQTKLSVGEICSLIKDCPTVDAEPVRYAKRLITKSIEKDRYGCYPRYRIKCSECGYEAAFSKYCPNCGAKMEVQ